MFQIKAENIKNAEKAQIKVVYEGVEKVIDDVTVLTGLNRGTGDGVLLVGKGENFYIPNDLVDRQAITDLLTNISNKLTELATFAQRANSGQVPDPDLPADIATFNNTVTQLINDITTVKEDLK